MGYCDHMVGLEEGDDGYLPVYQCRPEINWPQMSELGYIFAHCPYCGDDITAEFKSPTQTTRSKDDG